MKTSLKNRILSYFQKNPNVWIPKGHISRLVEAHTKHLGETAGRRLRELAESGQLEAKEEKGHVHYRYKQSNYEVFHRQMSMQ